MFSNIISILTILYLFLGVIYFGSQKKSYSHIRHTISELGEVGYINSKQISYGFFLPIGLLLALLALVVERNFTQGLAASLAAGYIIAAFFPCDDGSPFTGTSRQMVHNLGGFAEYAGGTIFLFLAAEQDANFLFLDYKISGIIVFACTVLISIPGIGIRGLVQRIAELLLFGSLLNLVLEH